MELRLTPLARQDLDEIWSFIACDSLDAADKFIDRILEKCRLVAENPGLGRSRYDLALGVRGFPVGNYLIFYHVSEDALFVDRVLSGYRDLFAVDWDKKLRHVDRPRRGRPHLTSPGGRFDVGGGMVTQGWLPLELFRCWQRTFPLEKGNSGDRRQELTRVA